jgi:hypothetical protein
MAMITTAQARAWQTARYNQGQSLASSNGSSGSSSGATQTIAFDLHGTLVHTRTRNRHPEADSAQLSPPTSPTIDSPRRHVCKTPSPKAARRAIGKGTARLARLPAQPTSRVLQLKDRKTCDDHSMLSIVNQDLQPTRYVACTRTVFPFLAMFPIGVRPP